MEQESIKIIEKIGNRMVTNGSAYEGELGTKYYSIRRKVQKKNINHTPLSYLQCVLKQVRGKDGRLVRLGLGIGLKWKVIDFEEYKGDVLWFMGEVGCVDVKLEIAGRFVFIDAFVPTCIPPRKLCYWLRGYFSVMFGFRNYEWCSGYYAVGGGLLNRDDIIKWIKGRYLTS